MLMQMLQSRFTTSTPMSMRPVFRRVISEVMAGFHAFLGKVTVGVSLWLTMRGEPRRFVKKFECQRIARLAFTDLVRFVFLRRRMRRVLQQLARPRRKSDISRHFTMC